MFVIYKPTGQLGQIPDDKFDPNLFEVAKDPREKPGLTYQQPQPQQPMMADNTPAVQEPQRSFIDRLGQGVVNIGKSMAAPVGRYLTGTAELGGQVNRMVTDPAYRKSVMGGDLSPEEAEHVANMSPGVFANEEQLRGITHEPGENITQNQMLKDTATTASYLVPGGQATRTGRLAASTASGAMAGYGTSEQGRELQGTAGGGVFGLGMGVVGEGVRSLKGAGKRASEVGDDLQTNVKVKGKTTPTGPRAFSKKQALEKKIKDLNLDKLSPEKAQEAVNNLYDDYANQLDDVLANSNKKISLKDVQNEVIDYIQQEGDYFIPDDTTYSRYLQREMKRLAKMADDGTLDAKSLNSFKTKLGNQLSKAFEKQQGIRQGDLTMVEGARMDIWNKLDDIITQLSPEAKDLTTLQSELYRVSPFIEEAMKGKGPYISVLGTGIRTPQAVSRGIRTGTGKAVGAAGGVMQGAGRVAEAAGKVQPQIVAGAVNMANAEQPQTQPQPEESIFSEPPGQTTTQPQQTITGRTVDEHRRAYINATRAGDKNAAAQIKRELDMEQEYQESRGVDGVDVGQVSSQSYANSMSGMDSLRQTAQLIFNPDGSLDKETIAALKVPGTPSQKARQLKAHLYNVADSYLRLRTGAQANPTEIEKLAASLEPGLLDDPKTIQTKLEIYDSVFSKYIDMAGAGGVGDQLSFSNGQSPIYE